MKVQGILLSLAYLIFGKLALLLSIPPGYATAIWPAAGIGLVGILLLGSRAWPYVFFGSFFINFWTSAVSIQDMSSLLHALPTALIIGFGATLQAVVGAHLVRKKLKPPYVFDNEFDIFYFLAIGGLLSCLVSASIGVTGLVLSGAITKSSFMIHWMTWWVGDAIGVMICGPLLLIVFGRVEFKRKLAVTIPSLIVLTLAVFAYIQTRDKEVARQRLEFNRTAAVLSQAIEQRVQIYIAVLHSLEGLFNGKEQPNQEDFQRFAQAVLPHYPGILAFSWNYKITRTERKKFELEKRILDLDSEGKLVSAQSADEYVVPRYVASKLSSLSDTGLNLLSDPIRRQAIERARDTGEAVATEPIKLVQDSSDEQSFLILDPVYKYGLPHGTAQERQRNILGYVTAVIRINDLLAATIGGIPRNGLDMRIEDDKAMPRHSLLYATFPDSNRSLDREKNYYAEIKSKVASRSWTLQFVNLNAKAHSVNWYSWLVLVLGLVFTTLFSALLLLLTGRTSRIETIVREQTSELEKSDRRLNLALDAAQMAVWEVDVRTGIVGRSKNHDKLFGIQTQMPHWDQEVFFNFVHPEDVERIREMSNVLSTTRDIMRDSFRIVWPDKTIRWVETCGYLERDENDNPTRMLGLIMDVTERKTSELARQRSEEQFRGLLEAGPDANVIINSSGTIVFANSEAEMLFGYAKQELIGKKIEDLIPERFREKHVSHRDKWMANPMGRSMGLDFEIIGVNKRGGEFPIEVSSNAFQGITETLFSCNIRDISLRKQGEQELLNAKNEALKAVRARAEFLANVSHEIRTPINGIIGGIELLGGTSLQVKQEKYLKVIDECSQSLLSLISDILDFSKIDSGEITVHDSDFDLHSLMESIEMQYVSIAQRKGLAFGVNVDVRAESNLYGDYRKLRQIMSNIINNAIKFTPQGAIDVKVTSELSGVGVVGLKVEVEDSGVGIPQAEAGKIFQPFSQIDNSSTREFGGTGLGLSICKSLVEAMGGQIGFRPGRDNRGTTFWFTVPLKKAKSFVQEAGKTSSVCQNVPAQIVGCGRVLIVEDAKTNQLILKEMLEAEGFIVSLADDGEQALQMLSHESYDLILMDCQLPKLDGYSVTQKIRQSADCLNRMVPIIAITAHASEADQKKCIAMGMNDYLSKPIRRKELHSKVNHWILENPIDSEIIHDLKTLETEGSPGLFSKLKQSYADSVPTNLKNIHKAYAAGRRSEVADIAHLVRSSSSNLGARMVAEAAKNLEDASRKESMSIELSGLINKVELEFERVKLELDVLS